MSISGRNYIYIYIYIVIIPDIGLGVRVFANGPGRVIPKTKKMVLDASLLNTQHYKIRIKGKVEQSREGVAPSPTLWCSSCRKGSLRVTLDYGRQLYFIYCHPQTDCFVLSELFSVARHAGRSKPGSKPVQLYVRLSF